MFQPASNRWGGKVKASIHHREEELDETAMWKTSRNLEGNEVV